MAKVIRLQESDLMELVKRVINEQSTDQAAQNLQTARDAVKTAKDARRDARQDLRAANKQANQAQRNEVNAIYDILKIRRQIGNLPTTIRNSMKQYQNTESFKPYMDSINAALAPIEALLAATANVTPPQTGVEGEPTA